MSQTDSVQEATHILGWLKETIVQWEIRYLWLGQMVTWFDSLTWQEKGFFLFIRGSWHLISKLLENDERTRWKFWLSARTLISGTGFIRKTPVTGTSGRKKMPGRNAREWKEHQFSHSVCRRWSGKESELCAGCFSFTCGLSCHTLAFLAPSRLQTQNTSACIPQGDHLVWWRKFNSSMEILGFHHLHFSFLIFWFNSHPCIHWNKTVNVACFSHLRQGNQIF